MKFLEDAPVQGQTILLRLALDVPLSKNPEKLVLDDTRLKESLPTIHFLLNRGARLILFGYAGRPNGQVVPDLSLRPVYLHLSALLKKPIAFASQFFSAETKKAVSALESGQILGLENMRFDKAQQENSRTFARDLAAYGDLFVNDDFSTAHRTEAAIVAITEFLPSYAGLALEKQYQVLTNLLRHPAQPFVAVIGGAKADKLPVIKQLIEKADRVLVGGGVANTFLAASGVDVGTSVVEKELFPAAKEILQQANGRLILPTDYHQSPDGQIFDIGPKTTVDFCRYLAGAKTIFWNGNLGKSEEPAYRHGSDTVARAIADSGATSIVGGGNTIGILNRLKLYDQITFVASGGGASLELLSGQVLPGIQALG